MPKFFEQIGSWLDINKDKKPERTPQECVEYFEDVAIVKPDTPEGLKQQAEALIAIKGFTEPLPSADGNGKVFCRPTDFERLAIDRGLIRYLSSNLAMLKPDIPKDSKGRFVDLVKSKGFTEPLPWVDIKGELYCQQVDFANLAKAQEVGDGSMTFKRSLVDQGLVTELEKYCDGYVFDKPLDSLPDARQQPFIVLVKKEVRSGQ